MAEKHKPKNQKKKQNKNNWLQMQRTKLSRFQNKNKNNKYLTRNGRNNFKMKKMNGKFRKTNYFAKRSVKHTIKEIKVMHEEKS